MIAGNVHLQNLVESAFIIHRKAVSFYNLQRIMERGRVIHYDAIIDPDDKVQNAGVTKEDRRHAGFLDKRQLWRYWIHTKQESGRAKWPTHVGHDAINIDFSATLQRISYNSFGFCLGKQYGAHKDSSVHRPERKLDVCRPILC